MTEGWGAGGDGWEEFDCLLRGLDFAELRSDTISTATKLFTNAFIFIRVRWIVVPGYCVAEELEV
jgi:hypothetical protein